MKQLTLLALAAALFISCSDDDTNNVSIDGTWKLTYVNMPGEPVDGNGDGIASENYVDETSCMDNTSIVFGNDDTATFTPTCISESQSPEAVTYEIMGDHIEFSYHVQLVPGFIKKQKFKRSGNKLTATFVGNSNDYVPGEGEFGDTSFFAGATFTYTKQ